MSKLEKILYWIGFVLEILKSFVDKKKSSK